MNDYERVARVIRFLDDHHTDQPDLATLADLAGLSPFHFHRLFSRWAGVTPKEFLRCLTLAHARSLLAAAGSVLGASLDAGLSGPGRLHDLCVALEAASPGEIKSGGAGWTLGAGFAESPFGTCLIGSSPRGICHLAFVEVGGEAAAWTELQSAWPAARLRRDDRSARATAARVFTRKDRAEAPPTLRAFARGTAFQIRVWRTLVALPAGRVTTYGRLASDVGQPQAARAVGTAVARNPLAYLIPCHRVIRSTGVVGEYRWGTRRKRTMIAWEGTRASGDQPNDPQGAGSVAEPAPLAERP